ncbi:MAG: cysteinyl-tRNA synthetase [Candidatus Omnitrophota bacterium]|jgi:cysteinyl-tRNA synthetase
MALKIYNSLGRTRQEFKSLEEGVVKMYVCGPTVYDLLHVGNFRGAIFFNLVRRWLEHLGYKVSFVYNYTDIDDKIIKRANEEGTDALALSQKYIEEFKADFAKLRLSPHDHNPKCSDHMQDMVDFVSGLIKKGHAYEVEGSVFFSIRSFKEYGKLSGRNIDELEAGHRVDPDVRKKDPLDFILWKPAKEGEPSWASPWGEGRPGWHLECSAMNKCMHGDQIDIHGGGFDLTFPHHENEIAQSEGLTGKTFATFWMHNNFINFGDAKMSKSIGNIVRARDFMETYNPEILRFMMLSVHYRSPLNLSPEQIHQAMAALARIYTTLKNADDILAQGVEDQNEDKVFAKSLKEATVKITDALNDDFNTPVMMASIFDIVRQFNEGYKPGKEANPVLNFKATAFKEWLRDIGKLSALFQENAAAFLKSLDTILIREKNIDVALVEQLIKDRNQARADKDFTKADEYRDALVELDILLQDTADGTIWEVKKT